MKLLFVGPLWNGSTALQRFEAFKSQPGTEVLGLDSMEGTGKASLEDRIRHRLRLPRDHHNLNERLLHTALMFHADVIFVDSTRLVKRRTIRLARTSRRTRVAYYSPDDVSRWYNSSRQLEACDREWDCFFTTKTFNVPELAARGVRTPVLIGNSYHPGLHGPLEPEEIGDEYESYDAVFVGTYEADRARALCALAEAGLRLVVYGSAWPRRQLPPSIAFQYPVYAQAYVRALHMGKITLGFLRKCNRDRITTRSIEVPACGRAMLAERSDEHDQHFVNGQEYVGFSSDDGLLAYARLLLKDDSYRRSVAAAGRARCLQSGYSTEHRAAEMLGVIGRS